MERLSMIVDKPGMCWGGQVTAVHPIEGADRIIRAEVVCGKGGKWSCVLPKGTKAGATVIVFMPDAIVPKMPETEFMEKYDWRVKMVRLKGCPSEVLAIPRNVVVGADYTQGLGVRKYEKEIPAQLAGDIAGNFPSFIPKTDELNFQVVPHFLKALEGNEYYITVKYDGSSQTIFKHEDHFGACSRNWELKTGVVWELIKRYDLESRIPNGLAIQWECIGPGIQGNPLKLKGADCRVFSAYNITAKEYMGLPGLTRVCRELNLPMVDVVERGTWEPKTDDELREMARGNYTESGKPREGIVIRPREAMRVDSQSLSFKVINLDYGK
jgi:RNA ligase (TIGR02306 family)